MSLKTISARDHDDAELQAERKWSAVLSQWLNGDPKPMAAWLADPATVLSKDAREFLADLVQGKVARPRGRRPRRSGQLERTIICHYFQEYEVQAKKRRITNPQERAFEAVAGRHNLSAGKVRGIVERLAKDGITLEWWQQWGRPFWTT